MSEMMKDTGVTRPAAPEWVTQQNPCSPSRPHLHDATNFTWHKKQAEAKTVSQSELHTFLSAQCTRQTIGTVDQSGEGRAADLLLHWFK